ncbi:MAG: UbiA prenyltransferase family protein [Candidatus Lokiarchaeum sp. GC14_75]|nr:MAG: UbiA prenyltransferase family protein [Candidatus Lokiarchaeum sp. GC14_75]
MSKGFRLLRLDYLFSVLIPCFLAIYLNNYDLQNNIWILAGFAFYAITGNTLNDVIDMTDPNEKETLERVEGYGRKEIFVLSIASFIIGTACFMKSILINPLLAVYLVIIVFLVIFYCLFKSLVIINHVILGVSHIVLPWFMIKINARDIIFGVLPSLTFSEIFILATIISVAFTGQMVHEMIDGDSLSKLKPKSSQLVIWIASIISLIIAIISFIVTQYFVFLPIIFFPLGIMYIFRKPRNNLLGRSSLKDTGILLGNLMFAYIIVLVIA